MKKISLVIGLFALFFLAACSQPPSGEAVSVGGKTVKLECTQIGSLGQSLTGDQLCRKEKYDACVDVNLQVIKEIGGVYASLFRPCGVDIMSETLAYEQIIKEVYPTLTNMSVSSSVTCCSVK